ncbi:phosphoribosylanthranilate isomerase [Alkalihalobacterium bogoriense]|uniref:phosphoribosylanthranilate isomerase n=1 Tax=Alkalihalobacterium bogoriense TaxID=246272 RepID=UPI000478E9E1|nr:phosphoribosylanthranilate isomerase [Alkalihalobacterium bogoriense]
MNPKLKFCGNHSQQDIALAVQSRASFIGVVFAESKRKVTASDVAKWIKSHPLQREQKLVGLFVNASLEEITSVLSGVSLDIIQLHGNETIEQVEMLSKQLAVPLWKVIHHEQQAWLKMEQYAPFVDGFVIDSKVKGQWGGTGTTFDWSHLPSYIETGKKLARPTFIAGGIQPSNIAELLVYQPDGIDMSSGIEEKGKKSSELMKQIEERIESYE